MNKSTFNLALKVITIAIAFAVLSSCSGKQTNSDMQQGTNTGNINTTSGYTVQLPYSAKDVLNPYKAETKQNQELTKLLFDPLFKTNDDFTVTAFVAESYESTQSTCTVKLKSVAFTDGSPLIADDIVYSFNSAKNNNVYSSQLKYISSCTAIDSTTVVFAGSINNPNLVNLLDFPIVKTGSNDLKDENNRTLAPIGCGRYTFSYTDKQLVANQSYYRGEIKLKTIKLIDCPDDDSLNHHVSVGNISLIYSDLSDNTMPKMSGVSKMTYDTTMVFVGANCNYGIMSNTKMRMAVSAAIDRSQVCSKSFYTFSEEAIGIFPSGWNQIKGHESLNKVQNLKQTVAYLEEIGYNSKDADGYYIDQAGKRITISLLCNSDNPARVTCAELVAAQLDKCGFEVSVVQKVWADYINDLTYGHFDVYIGEVRLDKSLYLGNTLSPNVIYGYPTVSDCSVKFAEYYSGVSEVTAAISSFATEMPFIPVCYKNGVIVYSDWLEGYVNFSISDIYNGIENYG